MLKIILLKKLTNHKINNPRIEIVNDEYEAHPANESDVPIMGN